MVAGAAACLSFRRSMLEVRLLGPVELSSPSGPPNGLTEKLRCLLAALTLREGSSVPTDDIIEELWPDEPPAGSSNALHAHMTRLRRALDAAEPQGRGGARLISVNGGYRLELGSAGSDLARFRLLRA